MDRPIALRQKGRLRMDVPDIGVRQLRLRRADRRNPRHIAEMIIQSNRGALNAGINIDVREPEAAQIVKLTRQLDIVVFDPGAPVATHGEFETEARGPAELVMPDDGAAAIVD